MIWILVHQPLDQVDLFQSDLNRILMLGPAGCVCCPQLSSHHTLPHPEEVRVGPFRGGPGRSILNVCGEIYFFQLVVDKLPDIPWQVIVSGKNILSKRRNIETLSYPSIRGTSVSNWAIRFFCCSLLRAPASPDMGRRTPRQITAITRTRARKHQCCRRSFTPPNGKEKKLWESGNFMQKVNRRKNFTLSYKFIRIEVKTKQCQYRRQRLNILPLNITIFTFPLAFSISG